MFQQQQMQTERKKKELFFAGNALYIDYILLTLSCCVFRRSVED